MTIGAEPFLVSGERLLWRGQPKKGIWFEPADVIAIPISVVWLATALSIFGLVATGKATHVDPMAFVILPLLVAVGLYFTVGRFFLARHARSRTTYFLTDQRAIICDGIFRRSERSINLSTAGDISLSTAKDGFGTIEFGPTSPFYRMMPGSWTIGQSRLFGPAFERIADANSVYRQILDIQRNAKIR